jgi:hypothetical protein
MTAIGGPMDCSESRHRRHRRAGNPDPLLPQPRQWSRVAGTEPPLRWQQVAQLSPPARPLLPAPSPASSPRIANNATRPPIHAACRDALMSLPPASIWSDGRSDCAPRHQALAFSMAASLVGAARRERDRESPDRYIRPDRHLLRPRRRSDARLDALARPQIQDRVVAETGTLLSTVSA